MVALLPDPEFLALRQDAVLTTASAWKLFGRAHVRRELRNGRWQQPAHGVVVLHNGPMSPSQRSWVGLLGSAPGAALAGATALEWDGFRGFERAETCVTFPTGARRPAVPALVAHWSVHLDDRDVHPLRFPRRTRPARSLVDLASWSDNERFARAVVLAGVQQRITCTRDLRDALTRRGPCRHRTLIIESILDAAGGIQSLPERDFDQIRIARRLPVPSRQVAVRRADGRYYLDVAWEEYLTACEIHGIPHLEVRQWDADNFRANEIAIAGPRQLVFSSFATRRMQDEVGDQLERMLRRGGWRP